MIIDERPCPLHLTCLEAVLKRPQVGVAKQPAEQVAGPQVGVAVAVGVGLPVAVAVCVCVRVGVGVGVLGATVVATGLVGHLGVRRGSGPVAGAVPLGHKVGDAQHGRVEDQVAPARLGGALGAGRVGPQWLAELIVEAIQ